MLDYTLVLEPIQPNPYARQEAVCKSCQRPFLRRTKLTNLCGYCYWEFACSHCSEVILRAPFAVDLDRPNIFCSHSCRISWMKLFATCVIPDCDNPACGSISGLCSEHVAENNKRALTARMSDPNATCSRSDCSNPPSGTASGLCSAHLAEVSKSALDRLKDPNATCSKPDCQNPPCGMGSGLCSLHQGEVASERLAKLKAPGATCSSDGCDNPPSGFGSGLCSSCLSQSVADHIQELKNSGATCIRDGCSNPICGSGSRLCSDHQRKVMQNYISTLREDDAMCVVDSCTNPPSGSTNGLCSYHASKSLEKFKLPGAKCSKSGCDNESLGSANGLCFDHQREIIERRIKALLLPDATCCKPGCNNPPTGSLNGLCYDHASEIPSAADRVFSSKSYRLGVLDRVRSSFAQAVDGNDSLGEFLDLELLDSLKSRPGVWSLWGKDYEGNGVCLTVGQTANLYKEIRWTLRILATPQRPFELEKPGSTGRWADIQDFYSDYSYRLICVDEVDFETREIIEAFYAVKNESRYWRPSPTQMNNGQTQLGRG